VNLFVYETLYELQPLPGSYRIDYNSNKYSNEFD